MNNFNTFPVQSRLDKNNYNRLYEIAKKKGVSISMLVRIILLEYLEKHNY